MQRNISEGNPYKSRINDYVFRIDQLKERLPYAKGLDRLSLPVQILYNQHALGGVTSHAVQWEKKQVKEEELEEEEFEEEELREEVEEEKNIYKSWLLTFETSAGKNANNRWVKTKVEVWVEGVFFYGNVPSDNIVLTLLHRSLINSWQWSWILNLGYKFQVEYDQSTTDNVTNELKVSVMRLWNYKREESWIIPL